MSAVNQPSWLTPGAMVVFVYDCNHSIYVPNVDFTSIRSAWKPFRQVQIGDIAMVVEYLVGWPDGLTNSVKLLMNCGTVVNMRLDIAAADMLRPV